MISYRPGPDGKEPYLLTAFERLLKERIEATLESLNEHDTEYRVYLEASLANLSACHAGYFSRDNDDSDEEIAKEVDVILHGKKQLLSFRNADGSYNTLRFSENSKLQEVGRGLRLPVDENGNRISNEEFHLNYIVDFTEADFAQRLVDQINVEIPQTSGITEERLESVAAKMGQTVDDLYDELYSKRYIDRHMNIRVETRAQFFEEYPLFRAGLSAGKVKDSNKDKPKPIKIRKAAYSEIKELWERINQRYLLFYDGDLNRGMESVVLSLLEKRGVFTDVVMRSSRDIVSSDGEQMTTSSEAGVQYEINRPIPYGIFLKRIMRTTNLPIVVLHNAMKAYVATHGQVDPKYINENSVSAFCTEFQDWKIKNLQGRFRYVKAASSCGTTALTYADGTPREEIAQGRIGTKLVPGTPSDKYLYDAFAYDSPLERANITTTIEKVVVYGKIPRNSIAIPTITGGMYSPDFMYVVKRASGEKEVNIVVETKDVEDKSVLRDSESAKIKCARVFFDILKQDGYTVYFRDQLNNKQMAQIINEVLQN